MEHLLVAALNLLPVDDSLRPFMLSCVEGQSLIGRVYESEWLTDSQKDDVVNEILQIMPISCAVPQLM